LSANFGACHPRDPDHFLTLEKSSRAGCGGWLENGHFFAAKRVGSCYKPAARGIAAGPMLFMRAWRKLVDALDFKVSSDESLWGFPSPSARTKRFILKRFA